MGSPYRFIRVQGPGAHWLNVKGVEMSELDKVVAINLALRLFDLPDDQHDDMLDRWIPIYRKCLDRLRGTRGKER